MTRNLVDSKVQIQKHYFPSTKVGASFNIDVYRPREWSDGEPAIIISIALGLSYFFGTQAGYHTTGDLNSFFGDTAGYSNVSGTNNTAVGALANVASGALDHATAIGANAIAPASNQVQIGRSGIDKVSIGLLGSGASTSICMANSIFSLCSSSRRYKENIEAFGGSFSLLQRLRPVTFDWKGRKEHDLGLVAEEVFDVEPLLVTHNDKGEIEGVKYDKLTIVLINAMKEQQTQIEDQHERIRQQQKQISDQRERIGQQQQQIEQAEASNQQQQNQLKRQQIEMEGLKKLVCQDHQQAELCKQEIKR